MADNTNQSSDRDATGQFTGGAASRDAGRKGGQASSGSFRARERSWPEGW